MFDLLDRAFQVARNLPRAERDAVARVLLDLVEDTALVTLTSEQRDAIAISKAAASRGEFATDEEVAAVWRRHEP